MTEVSQPMSRRDDAFQATPYHPAAWLPGAHAQTIAGRFLRSRTGVHYRRERISTPDGDFLDLDWATVHGRPAPAADAPLVLVVHGLEGSAASSYVLETCRALWDRGLRSVAMNFRSCSGEMNRTARFYHAGASDDVALVLELLAAREPETPLGMIGYSLGANMTLKYLGETGAGARVRAAAAVSVPFDLGAGSDKLDASVMGRFYTGIFVRSLRRKYRQKRALIGDTCNDARVLKARSFREFDGAATAPLHGFRDAEHYYGSQSSKNFLAGVRVPTLVIHAVDDPFVAEKAIERQALAANPAFTAVITPHGGHVGFIAGPPWAPRFWAEAEATRFLAERL